MLLIIQIAAAMLASARGWKAIPWLILGALFALGFLLGSAGADLGTVACLDIGVAIVLVIMAAAGKKE